MNLPEYSLDRQNAATLPAVSRFAYMRTHVGDLQRRFGLSTAPSVWGMIVVGSPQPMERITIPGGKDAITVRKDNLTAVRKRGKFPGGLGVRHSDEGWQAGYGRRTRNGEAVAEELIE